MMDNLFLATLPIIYLVIKMPCFLSNSDVDVTGILELSVNSSTYHVADDSVVLKADGKKYQDFDDLMSDSDSRGVFLKALFFFCTDKNSCTIQYDRIQYFHSTVY